MEWWSTIKIFWTIAALVTAAAAIVFWIRARGVLSWRRSLKAEIASLEDLRLDVSETGRQAINIIQARCRAILNDISPEIVEVRNLPDYIQSIAACYFPDADRPELQITVRAFLDSLQKSLFRLDMILGRTGFKKLRTLSINRIVITHGVFLKISDSPFYRWYSKYRQTIQRLGRLRVLFYVDPLLLIAFLSNRVTILVLVKYLLVDLHLYFGKLTLEAFEKPQATDNEEYIKKNLEETLSEMESQEDNHHVVEDPQIEAIRNRLVGLSSIVMSDPTIGAWKNAVRDAGEVIAARYFPEAEKPLGEAAVGPLLERGLAWLTTLSKGEEYLVTRRFYRLRLETLFQAKDISRQLLPVFLRGLIKRAYITYGWAKWPLKVYRWSRKSSPLGVALEIGWQAAKKASLARLYGMSFDRACQELEIVYRDSRDVTRKGREQRSEPNKPEHFMKS
jgi:hypothetical protein